MAIDVTKVLAGLPPGLRNELLTEYQSLASAFQRGQWKYASLDGGRFCEVVYTIIDGALSGTFPAAASKPSNFSGDCMTLASRYPAPRLGNDSLRLIVPHVLIGLYDVRNKRNVGHVSGEIAASHMDATLVHATAAWVMAELVRVFHNVPTQEAQRTVDALVDRSVPLIWEEGEIRRVLDTEMPHGQRALVLLYGQTGWTPVERLSAWCKYSNLSVFRTKVVGSLDVQLLIEFDQKGDRCLITPLGTKRVEEYLLK